MVYEEYLSAGAHIGLKQKSENMKEFIFKVRPDGLAVLNVETIDKRIKIAAKFLARSKNIIVVSKRDIDRKAVKKFAEIIDAKSVIGRFLPGIITNPSFRHYMEPELLVISDTFYDKQAIKEAVSMRVPIISFCDTANITKNIDLIIPCNNKGRKSLATLYFLLAREILKERKKIKEDSEYKYKIEDFFEEEKRQERRPREDRRFQRRGRR